MAARGSEIMAKYRYAPPAGKGQRGTRPRPRGPALPVRVVLAHLTSPEPITSVIQPPASAHEPDHEDTVSGGTTRKPLKSLMKGKRS